MANSAHSFDVFLSYNWRDHREVVEVADSLRERGLNVFLDRWYLVPGRPWPQALEEVVQKCGSVAVFLGSQGMGPWQQREQYLALERQSKDAAFAVIPVLLPGSDPALGFLGLNTWVDLRKEFDNPAALDVLAAAIRREAPGPAVKERQEAVLESVCPYRGLRAFREEDAPFFFGRDTYVTQLAQRIRSQNLVAVVGASGSGKSSVVQAGLVPALRRNTDNTVWEIVTLFPGDRPLHAMAAAMVPLLEPEMTETDRLAEISKLANHFREGTVALRDVVERVLKKQPGTDRLLLVADQWEELYTLSRDEEDVRKFMDELLEATATVPINVVLTVRGDFYGRVLSNRAFVDRLQDSVENLGPMNREELEHVMTMPAGKVGLSFQSGLANRLLDDVGEEPGNLPLLEFVLTSLWDRRHRGGLLHEAYDYIGGMQGAIAKRADEVYDRLPIEQQGTVRRIFLQLVRPGAGSEDTRRRATFEEVGEEAHQMLDELAHQRLLVTGRDEASGEETVEVAHEALIQNWSRLRQWLEEDRDFLMWRQRLQVAIGEWQRTGHDAGTLLRGAPLAEAERWVRESHDALSHDEKAFISESVHVRNRGRGLIWAGVAAVVLVAVVVAVWQYTEANRLRAIYAPIEPEEMVEILPGKFMMGAAEGDSEAYKYGYSRHEVKIKKPFRMSKYEVTFKEYDAFCRAKQLEYHQKVEENQNGDSDAPYCPLDVWGRGQMPVFDVSWEDAVAYADWLSRETGKRYRLPTEAEWEYAARSGGKEEKWAGTNNEWELDNYAWYGNKSQMHPVGQKKPNGLGLYDMSGNVWEWVQDCWHFSYDDAPKDGTAWEEEGCTSRVLRGGAWNNDAGTTRTSFRTSHPSTLREGGPAGFRLVMSTQ